MSVLKKESQYSSNEKEKSNGKVILVKQLITDTQALDPVEERGEYNIDIMQI